MAIRYLSGVNVDSNTLFVDDANNRVGIGTATPTSPGLGSSPALLNIYRASGNAGLTLTIGSDGWDIGNVGGNGLWFLYNNSTKAVITNAGNVGIGTTSPSQKLDVSGSIKVTGNIFIGTAGVSNNIYFADSSSTQNIRINSYTDNTLFFDNFYGQYNFRTTNSYVSRLYISNGGNVGIGTTSPAVKLHVVGSSSDTVGTGLLRIEGGGGGGNVSWTFRSTVTNNDLTLDRQYAGAYYQALTFQRSTGNVGIGTTTPKENLHIVGGTGSGTVSRLRIGGEGTGNNESTLQLVEHVQGDDMIYGYSFTADGNNTNNFLLKRHSNSVGGSVSLSVGRDTGYVGILTNNPSKELDVVGTLRIQGTNTYDITSDNDALQHTLNSAVRGFKFNNNNGNLLSITSAGNVGIGTTSPSEKLEVVGNITLTNAYPKVIFADNQGVPRSFSAGTNNETFIVRNETASTDVIAIQGSTSNVGIGTTSPAYKLDVNGDVNIPFGTSNGYRINTNRILSQGSGFFEFGALDYKSTYPNISTNSDGTFRIQSNGSTLVTVNQSGNVGIGTTNPFAYIDGALASRALQIAGSGRTAINIQDTSGTNYYLNIGVNGANAFIEAIYSTTPNISYAAYNDHIFVTRSSERMRINSAGNVFFGATSAVSFETFGVAHQWSRFYTTSATEYAVIDVGNATTKVKIGVDSSTGGGLATGTSAYASYVGSSGAYPLQLGSYGGVAITVNSSNDVGIGTTSPSEKLHVIGNTIIQATSTGNGTTAIRVNNSAGTQVLAIGAAGEIIMNNSSKISTVVDPTSTQPQLELYNGGTGYTTLQSSTSYGLLLNPNGANVGIGTTSPSQKLDVNGIIQGTTGLTLTGNAAKVSTTYSGVTVTNFFTDTGGGVISVDGSNKISLRQGGISGTDAVTIAGTGNVGIGTTSPSYKLQVNADGDGLYVRGASISPYNQTIASFVYGGNSNSINIENQGGKASIQARVGASTMDLLLNAAGSNVGIGTTSPAYKLDVNGNARVGADGGAASVAIAGDGSTTGGFLYSDTNQTILSAVPAVPLIFRTTNSERMRITAAGNVGIGTTTPAYKLDVSTNLGVTFGASSYLRINKESLGDIGLTAPKIYSGTETLGFQSNNGTTSFNFAYGATSLMTMMGNGNVGIGTSSPSAKLDVVASSSSVTNNIKFGDGTKGYLAAGSTGVYLSDNNGVSAIMFKHDTRYVGIGTTAPESLLHLSQASVGGDGAFLFIDNPAASTLGNTAGIRFATNTGASFSGYGSFIQAVNTNAVNGAESLTFGTWNGTSRGERMRILHNGYVGIGTTSPNAKLAIKDGSNADLEFFSESSGTALQSYNRTTSTWGYLRFLAGGGEQMRIHTNGNVGIGTTSPNSSYKLDVAGAIRTTVVSGYTIDASATFGDNSGGTITIINRGTTRALRILGTTSSGWGDVLLNPYGARVGIGTTDPTQALHVSGNARVTGAYYDSNNSAGTSGQVLSSTGSGTDWVSLSEITGVDGTGTANKVSKWSDADTITDSTITDDGTTVTAGVERFKILYQAGIYSFSDTVNASTSEDIFSISNDHGAQAFRVTFVCSTSGFSVAKTYEVVHSYGNTPIAFKVVDSGPYSGNDFDVAFTDATSTGIKCAITNNSTTVNANIVTTIFLGGSPTTITVTEH